MLIVLLFFGVIAGYFAAILGIGSGCILMPIFIIVGIPYETAVEASLMAVFLSSLTSSMHNYKIFQNPLTGIMAMACSGAVFAAIGNLLLMNLIPVIFLELMYVGVMLTSVDLLRWAQKRNKPLADLATLNHDQYLPLYIVIGAVSGMSASLLGIGGGILIVSLLVGNASYSVIQSVKISSIIMTVTTLIGLLSEITRNTLPFSLGAPVALGAVAGGFFGTIALKYVNQQFILKANYVVSFTLGMAMLSKVLLNSI